MNTTPLTRREFLTTCAAGSAALAVMPALSPPRGETPENPYVISDLVVLDADFPAFMAELAAHRHVRVTRCFIQVPTAAHLPLDLRRPPGGTLDVSWCRFAL